MASMNMVELVPTGQVAKELATQVVRVMTHTGATEEAKARVQDFIAQCKERVRSRDAPGFVSTVLTSAADDLFNFPKRRVLEDVFSVLVSMLNNASRTSDVSSTLDQLCEVVTSSTTGQTESRLLILGTAFNMFSSAAVRFKLFLEVTRYAAKTNQLNLVKPYFSDAAGWADTWELDIAERRQLYTVIATVLEEDGDFDAAQTHRVKLLETYEGASEEELSSDSVREAAVKTIVGFVKTPAAAAGKKHLVDMASVRQLENDAEHGRLYELLNIFATQKVDAYMAYREANAEYMTSHGIDHAASLETIRLFSLCSLAAESEDGSIPYSTIARTLQVDEEETEEWVFTAVRAGLISGRMDQLANTVYVSGYKRRVFDQQAWREIQTKLHRWHDSVSGLLSTLRSRTGGRV